MSDDGERSGERDQFRRGLPDHHDPTSGIGGAPPARSALTLRLVLAIFGLVAGVLLALWASRVDAPTILVVVPAVMAVTAAVDIVVVARRKRRGEPG
ncbi:DUF6343 family protein [Georgenia subflava]|uniref:Uncharacterized protein n=1 Tax=Georgenia subflava TaxID=1622177 RepID=A0A6N7EFD8_9MICO|nr:DUF6343 family protein [Georgenia subflava]MPV35903.1 hypothetical protein [Georgenia subflava]